MELKKKKKKIGHSLDTDKIGRGEGNAVVIAHSRSMYVYETDRRWVQQGLHSTSAEKKVRRQSGSDTTNRIMATR
jgi:hypothetical protein